MNTEQTESKPADGRSDSNAGLGVFTRLQNLPADHPFWKNKWNFTRPVFTNESRKREFDTDEAAFMAWHRKQYAPLYKYINSAPNVKLRGWPVSEL